MNRTELTIAIAAALVLAVLLGWVLRWTFGRLNAEGAPDAELTSRLQAAEEACRHSERRLAEAEAAMATRLSDVQAEAAATLDSLARARSQAEEIPQRLSESDERPRLTAHTGAPALAPSQLRSAGLSPK